MPKRTIPRSRDVPPHRLDFIDGFKYPYSYRYPLEGYLDCDSVPTFPVSEPSGYFKLIPSRTLRRGLQLTLCTSRDRRIVVELTYRRTQELILTLLLELETNSHIYHRADSAADEAFFELVLYDNAVLVPTSNRAVSATYRERHHIIHMPDKEYLSFLEFLLCWVESVTYSTSKVRPISKMT